MRVRFTAIRIPFGSYIFAWSTLAFFTDLLYIFIRSVMTQFMTADRFVNQEIKDDRLVSKFDLYYIRCWLSLVTPFWCKQLCCRYLLRCRDTILVS